MVAIHRSCCRLKLALLVGGASVSLAACTSTPDGNLDRVERVTNEFAGLELSEFETDVFADGEVTQSEYDEAYGLWRSCAEGRGLTVEVERDDFGMYRQVTTRPKDLATDDRLEQDRTIADECGRGTLLLVDAVYRDQVLNPNSRDWNDGVVSCLVDNGLVEPDFDRDDLLSGSSPLPESAEVASCLENPFGIASGS